MAIETLGGVVVNTGTINTAGLPVVGGDQPGGNLSLRSTNSGNKGAVLVDENTHSYGFANGALQVPNGGVGVFGNVSAGGQFINMPVGMGVSTVFLSTAGSGYTSPPTVTFSAPQLQTGITATGVAQISGGAVIAVFITNPGFGYISPPTITFNNSGSGGSGAVGVVALGYHAAYTQGSFVQLGCVTSIQVTATGSGYTKPPQVRIDPPHVAGGIQATAVSTVSAGGVSNILITNPGSGYLYPPTVTLFDVVAGSSATFLAQLGHPGEKSMVTTFNTGSSAITLDFGNFGMNTAFVSISGALNVYFGYNATAQAGNLNNNYFPQGRKIILWVKNTAGTSQTVTFQNLTTANSTNASNAYAISLSRTARFECVVLTSGNLVSDVYVAGTYT